MTNASTTYFSQAVSALSRTLNHLKAGEHYSALLPCIQISILDTELFQKNDPHYTDAFYSEYIIKERTSGKEFSDKFSIQKTLLLPGNEKEKKPCPKKLLN